MKSENVKWHQFSISAKEQEKQTGHKGVTLWYTGLSGSGKSTVANAVMKKLFELGHRVYMLDADNLRHGLNGDLGFSIEDRCENIRRVGEVAKLFTDAGTIISAALISPLQEDRNKVRDILGEGNFIEIFINCPLDVCEERDPKGLYQKARDGQISEFTGITSPYEEPDNPEIRVNTGEISLQEGVDLVVNYLQTNGYLI